MIVKSTQFSLWLQCILFDNKLSISLSLSLSLSISLSLSLYLSLLLPLCPLEFTDFLKLTCICGN